MGRTARAGKKGRALLYLLPSELTFLKYLKEAKVPLNEYEVPAKKVANVQSELESLLEKNHYLHVSARDAYRCYLQSYASHSLKETFNVSDLDLQKVAKSFGFSVPPRVDLSTFLTTVLAVMLTVNAQIYMQARRRSDEAAAVALEVPLTTRARAVSTLPIRTGRSSPTSVSSPVKRARLRTSGLVFFNWKFSFQPLWNELPTLLRRFLGRFGGGRFCQPGGAVGKGLGTPHRRQKTVG